MAAPVRTRSKTAGCPSNTSSERTVTVTFGFSSSTMTPATVMGSPPGSAALEGLLRVRVKVSLTSATLSSVTGTAMTREVTPGSKVSVPLVSV